MMIFSVLTEDKNFIEKDGGIYAYDKNGKEYEITPSMVNRYWDKYGGRWKPIAWGLGGMAGGTALSFPAAVGTYMTMRDGFNADPSTRRLGMAAVQGALIGGGAGLGISHGMKNVYNDIAKKRLAGEFK